MATNLVDGHILEQDLNLIAIGGTGSRVLIPLLHLCALGLGPRKLKVLVIDADETNPSVQGALSLMDKYQRVRAAFSPSNDHTGLFRTEVLDAVPNARIWSPIAQQDFEPSQDFGTLVGAGTIQGTDLGTLFDLLFSKSDQEMKLDKGFRCVPAIGTIFIHRLREEEFFKNLIHQSVTDHAHFFVIGSLFGGTGAAGLPVVGELLTGSNDGQDKIPANRIGACLVLPYFRLPPVKGGDSDAGRRPNDATFAEAVRAALPHYIRSESTEYGTHYVIGDDDRREQPTNAVGGKEQDNIPDYIELMSALAALDFAARGPGEHRFRYTAVERRDVSWDDLPVTTEVKERLSSGIIAMQTFLTMFRPDGLPHENIGHAFQGSTWMKTLGWNAATLQELAPLFNALGAYFDPAWGWLKQCNGLALTNLGSHPSETVMPNLLAGWPAAKSVPSSLDSGNEIFRFWNIAAPGLRTERQERDFIVLLDRASVKARKAWYQEAGNATPAGGRRNLLPPFAEAQQGPGEAEVGAWTGMQSPNALQYVQVRQPNAVTTAVDVTSIPSPWARFWLFSDAIGDGSHPAQQYVKREVLDGLEFLWQHGEHPRLEWKAIDLKVLSRNTGSPASDNLAAVLKRFLLQLLPSAAQQASITVVKRHGRPILAASPLSLLVTAPDAAQNSDSVFFKGEAGRYRALKDRPRSFQEYIAEVLHAQLRVAADAAANNDPRYPIKSDYVLGTFAPWLREEAEEAEGIVVAFDGWDTNAAELNVRPCPGQFFGLILHSREAEVFSRWRLAPRRKDTANPIVIERDAPFDGRFYENATIIDLPDDNELRAASRERLPMLDDEMSWVAPRIHWIPDRILFLNHPVSREASYNPKMGAGDAAIRFAVPLTGDFFRYFNPSDAADLTSVKVTSVSSKGHAFGGVERVDFALTVPLVENKSITVRKIFQKSDFEKVGPDLSIWPSVIADDWNDYVIFRFDTQRRFADQIKVVPLQAGNPIEESRSRRTDQVTLIHTTNPPEAIEFQLDLGTGDPPKPLGTMVPRYESPPATQERWRVGVDFGTSNTVVVVADAANPDQKRDEIEVPVSHLTQGYNERLHYLNSFFFTSRLSGKPFGTAIVCSKGYHSLPEKERAVGTKLSVPILRQLTAPGNNDIWGDLKWSAEVGAMDRTKGFLSHLMATVCSAAMAQGVSRHNLTFYWSYPRAFSATQVPTLAGVWEFLGRTYGCNVAPMGIHESEAALAFFASRGQAGTMAKEPTILLDVGGGTADLAAYGGGDGGGVLFYDSLLFGGRNLIGRLVGNELNPFVSAFVEWACDAQGGHLDVVQRDAVEAYRRFNQEHLALGYLFSLSWFEQRGHEFAIRQEHRYMERIVLYFWSALFYYMGIWARKEPKLMETSSIILCGNGSRFLDWLTGFSATQPKTSYEDVFRRMFHVAAGSDTLADTPRINQSRFPKLEVVYGLVHQGPGGTNTPQARHLGPLAGEALELSTADQKWAPTDSMNKEFTLSDLGSLTVADGPQEVDRFHEEFLRALDPLSDDKHWAKGQSALREILERLDGKRVSQKAHFRLEQLVRERGGYKTSFFILEVGIVVEELLTKFFKQT